MEFLYVMAILTCFCFAALVLYGVILFVFAYKHHQEGFSLMESIKRAQGELK